MVYMYNLWMRHDFRFIDPASIWTTVFPFFGFVHIDTRKEKLLVTRYLDVILNESSAPSIVRGDPFFFFSGDIGGRGTARKGKHENASSIFHLRFQTTITGSAAAAVELKPAAPRTRVLERSPTPIPSLVLPRLLFYTTQSTCGVE